MTNVEIKLEIARLQDLLKTPGLNQQTIDEINVNLQELLRLQRGAQKQVSPLEYINQVFQDEK